MQNAKCGMEKGINDFGGAVECLHSDGGMVNWV
jgi:hypothetical protein